MFEKKVKVEENPIGRGDDFPMVRQSNDSVSLASNALYEMVVYA